jgi:predicted PurR-regulated permease PerM
MLDEQRYDFDRVFRLLISAATILLLFFLLRYLSEVLIPFVVAFLLAYLLHPLVIQVQRRVKNHSVAVLLTVMGVGLLFFGILAVLTPIVANELRGVNQLAGQLRQEGSDLQLRIQRSIEEDTSGWIQFAIEKTEQFVTSEQFLALAGEAARRLAPGIQAASMVSSRRSPAASSSCST